MSARKTSTRPKSKNDNKPANQLAKNHLINRSEHPASERSGPLHGKQFGLSGGDVDPSRMYGAVMQQRRRRSAQNPKPVQFRPESSLSPISLKVKKFLPSHGRVLPQGSQGIHPISLRVHFGRESITSVSIQRS